MSQSQAFAPGSIVKARDREWVVLPQSDEQVLHLRPLGSGEDQPTILLPELETTPVTSATFPWPTKKHLGVQSAGLLLRDALMLRLRAGAGPFRSFGNIAVEPRAYQLVPLMMALKLQTVRLLIADDVGIGKTIEAGLIARELMDRGEIDRLAVLCPPHLCDQWQRELKDRFHINAEIVRSTTAARLERKIPAGSSLFDFHPHTIVSLDYIKSKTRRDAFAEQCPDFVIVDEAHTCSRAGKGRQQRYELLHDLSQKAERHLLLLTATPHSGDEEAFYNLLGLLDEDFEKLVDIANAEHPLRQRLANHFVQRRRQDIVEWRDGGTQFPDRQSAEATYKLSGAWHDVFEQVMDYARELIEREQEGTHRARMNWWAALALLRCISSSPRAAIRAFQTRIDNTDDGELPDTDLLDAQGLSNVLDNVDENTHLDDVVPGAALQEDITRLQALIEKTESLTAKADPKLQALIKQLTPMLTKDELKPVIFCRYIATAEYLADELAKKFKKHHVTCVTGNLTPSEREALVNTMREQSKPPLLVATDCLSEGINLQDQFSAVVHYDLSWNPTRHEQREGRVDRFGQTAPAVKALMLYGEDNPIDGAVLQVILRKAENIRKALGVSVPMPEDDNKITQAIMKTVLLSRSNTTPSQGDMFSELKEDSIVKELDTEWESAREKTSRNRTIFAQNRLKPEDVMEEWGKAFASLGSETDVERFVTRACERLGAPIQSLKKGGYQAPLEHFPEALRERLKYDDLLNLKHIDFSYPPKNKCAFIHRTHPLVSHLADYLTEIAMRGDDTSTIARAGTIFSKDVKEKQTVYLLRMRSRLRLRRSAESRDLLAEEALAITLKDNQAQLLNHKQTLAILQSAPSKNMSEEQRTRELGNALQALEASDGALNQLANNRADDLLGDHRRVRDAADARGSYDVNPQLPPDVIGVYTIIPDLGLL
ncbi:helicase SNF2 [Chromatiales bacterium (ex Bugula neritina AB1)]|nr:helicase SNF2 [Chromatiales bacterium (ex Bugula neritina AB1)]